MKKVQSGNDISAYQAGKIKAIALLSGGLDGTLAAAIVKRAGVEVIGLHLQTLFDTERESSHYLAQVAKGLGIKVRTVDLSEEQVEVVRHPKHGYGAGVNPCIDCRIMMLQAAKRVMEEQEAQFVITGEVLGQRPMSQHLNSLTQIAKESGLGDRLLRPLSANLLADSLPVVEGWVKREDLLSLQGRGRKEQIELAEELGIRDYPQAAGGCLLVSKAYTARLRDAFAHIGKDEMTYDDFKILKHGRHFRLSERVKVIAGRDEGENAILSEYVAGRTIIEPRDTVGSLVLVEGDPSLEELTLAARLAARYSDHKTGDDVAMCIKKPSDKEETVSVEPLSPEDERIDEWRID